MLKRKIIFILTGAIILIVLIAAALFIINRNKNKAVKVESIEKGSATPKETVSPVLPPEAGKNIPPPPEDITKKRPPKKLEQPPIPPKMETIPESVPTHIDVDSLRAPSPKAPPKENK